MPDNSIEKISKISLYKLIDNFDVSIIENSYKLKGKGQENNWEYSIYTKISPPQPPSWLPLVKSKIVSDDIGKNIYISLIVIFKKNEYSFALTAGYGYVDIYDYSIQDYGIEVALRSADPHELKNLIQKSPIGNVFSFNRILRGNYVPESDAINKKSVLRQIAGKCKDLTIGKSISGTTSLVISGQKNFPEVIQLLDKLIIIEKKEPVVKISGLKQVSKEYVSVLNDILFEKIKQNDFSDLFLCYEDEKIQIKCEKIKIGKEMLNFDDYESIFKKVLEKDTKHPENVYLIGLDENDKKLPKRKLFNLLEGEVEYKGSIYFRINKGWYKAGEETVKEIEKEFSEIKCVQINYLKDWAVKSGKPEEENDFLNRVFDKNPNLIKAHTKKLMSGCIEFADIYDKENKRIIHVKKGRGAFLRCLFAQGYVSGKLLAGDSNFRGEVKDKFGIDISNHEENKIVLAIFNPNEALSPFTLFAKVDLVERVSALKDNGYVVEYCLINSQCIS